MQLRPTAGKKMRLIVCPPPPHMRAGGGNDGNRLAADSHRRGGVNPREALRGWIRFMKRLASEFGIELIVMPAPPRPMFDTTFPRDLYFVVPGMGIFMSRMVAGHRLDEPHYMRWFLETILGLKVVGYIDHLMEGRSCFHFLPNGNGIIYGHGMRSEPAGAEVLHKLFNLPVVSVGLTDWAFHADVAGTSLSGCDPAVLWCREALANPKEWDLIADACSDDKSKLIELSLADALRYGANTRVLNRTAVAPPGMSTKYQRDVTGLGYGLQMIDLGPLHKDCGGFFACSSNDWPEDFYEHDIPEEYRGENAIPLLEAALPTYPTMEMAMAA